MEIEEQDMKDTIIVSVLCLTAILIFGLLVGKDLYSQEMEYKHEILMNSMSCKPEGIKQLQKIHPRPSLDYNL